jgi:hypothetical protein
MKPDKSVTASTDSIRGNEGSVLIRLALPNYALLPCVRKVAVHLGYGT